MRNLKLLIEYEGTAYCGWQRQENGRTIQGEIESALLTMTGEAVAVHGAGRTDAGVHARGQAANFRTGSSLSVDAFRGGLNGLLPPDIVVLDVAEAPPDFHARYSARSRTYSYTIATRPTALRRSVVWQLGMRLDEVLMNESAALIVGDRDFKSFCRALAEVEHHRCLVSSAGWVRNGGELRFTITANRFLHGMVRALVGTMVDVGRGALSIDGFRTVAAAGDRRMAGMAAPPSGLVLEHIDYPALP